ncbi:MAG: hypothetical protein JWP92_2916 [Caulobacter sp.]|jgi:hypothetical protein|nr:hypothetical protein [Caulobacter sp.]
MIKLAALSALALTTALVALPAAAADLRISPNGAAVVRVSLAGKSSVQIQADLKAAADTVCAAQGNMRGESLRACVTASLRDARSQLVRINPALASAKPTKVLVAREDKSVIRVAVAGKSELQLSAEINTAAETVCKVSTGTTIGASFRSCVTGAVKDANAQLREIAQARPQLLASR